jgi:hypothetical protein
MRTQYFLLFLIMLTCRLNGAETYGSFFTDATMRLDYNHTGTSVEEYFSLDQVYREGSWPGSKRILIDSLNLGTYLVKVKDMSSNQLIYSRGFCTIFAEWQTTQEALDGVYRTMHETVRFPYPLNPVEVVIAVRDKITQRFTDRFSTIIDPNSRFVNMEKKKFPFHTGALINNGDPCHKVDVAVLADGFTKKEMGRFRQSAKNYIGTLFDRPPFKNDRDKFNIWLVEAVSQDSGIDDPRENQWRQNILGTSYNIFDLPRYALALDNKTIRDIASLVPYDYIYILTNSSRYGGGGIYNWQATCFTGTENDNPAWWSDYVFIHEFGHLFAGLADEYYSSEVAYQEFYPKNTEPWEPNITRLLIPDSLKWKDLVPANTPIPTPWSKAEFDSLQHIYAKARSANEKEELKADITEMLGAGQHPATVGCYEGAGYSSTGLYRPSLNCIMFSKSLVDFCPVCQRAIERNITLLTK